MRSRNAIQRQKFNQTSRGPGVAFKKEGNNQGRIKKITLPLVVTYLKMKGNPMFWMSPDEDAVRLLEVLQDLLQDLDLLAKKFL